MIMSWIWNSIQPEISRNLMFLSKYLGDASEDVLYEARCCNDLRTKTKVSSGVQGSLSLTECYICLNGLWLEIDHYQDLR